MTKKLLAAALLSALLGACATTAPKSYNNIPANTAALNATADHASEQVHVSQSERKIIAYYSSDGELAGQPMRGGYYRVLLGRNADGKAVVQDFYQDNQTKQINAVVIPNDQDLQNFDVIVSEGRTIWYTPEGRITSFVDIQNGTQLRKGYYDEQGRLALSIEGDPRSNSWSRTIFYENGNPIAIANTLNDKTNYLYFHEDGRKVFQINQIDGSATAWNQDGSIMESEINEIPAVWQKTLEHANELRDKYLLRDQSLFPTD
ncbi:hypothetical protein [Neisseria shayeganii]|uniref:Lipoprotein n=1 Tax=Neisseria shayeganii 871 TaxID=1032488 RepID=G4CHE6_9NEIS|nr:hypothetical protein [Neisseria shayeganii]EGY52730.1 hypothetical protein HMPREF9371_1035 [Neisseria shayeganii 871]